MADLEVQTLLDDILSALQDAGTGLYGTFTTINQAADLETIYEVGDMPMLIFKESDVYPEDPARQTSVSERIIVNVKFVIISDRQSERDTSADRQCRAMMTTLRSFLVDNRLGNEAVYQHARYVGEDPPVPMDSSDEPEIANFVTVAALTVEYAYLWSK